MDVPEISTSPFSQVISHASVRKKKAITSWKTGIGEVIFA
jgi:hypothetical protein